MEIPENRKVRVWICFWPGIIRLAFFRDLFRSLPQEGLLQVTSEADLNKIPVSIGRDIIAKILRLLPENGYLNIRGTRVINILWPINSQWWPSAEKRIIECLRKVLRYSKEEDLTVTKRLELCVAMPAHKTIVNVGFWNRVFYLQFIGRDVFHEALPKNRNLKVEDLIPVTDDEQILLRRFIRIAGQDGHVQIYDARNGYIDIGNTHEKRKKGLLLKALKAVFGHRVEKLPSPKAGAFKKGERYSFSF